MQFSQGIAGQGFSLSGLSSSGQSSPNQKFWSPTAPHFLQRKRRYGNTSSESHFGQRCPSGFRNPASRPVYLQLSHFQASKTPSMIANAASVVSAISAIS